MVQRWPFIVLAAAVSLTPAIYALPSIHRKGRYMYSEDGTRFTIRGIAYQEQGQVLASATNAFLEPSTFIDPLSLDKAAQCASDALQLSSIGVNVIRVYSVNSSLNHDVCMKSFSNSSIYTIIDLALPLNGSIDRVSPSWSTNLLNQYIQTIDAFSHYDNVLAYNVGNEVVLQNITSVSPFVKAAARDIKAYLSSKNSTALVGYSAINGDSTWRGELANYLSCDPSSTNSDSTTIDLYGLNDYEWCGNGAFANSYAATTSAFANYNLVAYFSEFGCITSPPRLWTEVTAMFSSDMDQVWSGGIAFSYFDATSAQGDFGMTVTTNGVTTDDSNQDLAKLKAQYTSVTPPISPAMGQGGPDSYPSCPSKSETFDASTTLPPTPNNAACSCFESTLSCQFAPQTPNYTTILGQLLDFACSLLGQVNQSCDQISSNGSTGTYGLLSPCDPTIKLSYVMSTYYELQNRNPEACYYNGNATVNPLAPASASVAAATKSCATNSTAVFTPTSSSTASNHATTSISGKSGSVSLVNDMNSIMGLLIMTFIGVVGGIWNVV